MLRELRGAITALALVTCAILALVSFDVGIPGQELLQSLRFHIAAVLFGLIVLLLLSGAWWRAVLLLLPLIASVGEGATITYRQEQLRIAAAAPGTMPLFRLLSFNLLNSNTRNGEAIAGYIVASGADIVMLMEAGPLSSHREKVFAAYPYNMGCIDYRDCSTVILSKWPLSEIKAVNLSQPYTNRLVSAVADIDGTRVNLVLAHMSKPYFDDRAAADAYRIARLISGLQGPVLLAGDFNAAAWSATIARLARTEDLAPGPAYPATWPVELGPFGVPIDNVLARAPLVIESVRAMDDPLGSNHRGLISEIAIAKAG